MPKFTDSAISIQVKNGPHPLIVFAISVKTTIHGLQIEIFTIVSEIHDHVDLLQGHKKPV